MPRVRGRERGVPKGWCAERKVDPKKFDPSSFRTVCYTSDGKRAKCGDPDAIRGMTIGCPRGKFSPKKKSRKYTTRGVCNVGTKVQRVLKKPGHYGCKRSAR